MNRNEIQITSICEIVLNIIYQNRGVVIYVYEILIT